MRVNSYALKKSHFLWQYLISLGYEEECVLGMASSIVSVWARLRHYLGEWSLGESGTILIILECLLDTDQLSKRDAELDRFVLIVVTALFCFDRAVASNSRNRANIAANWLERADELYFYSSRNHNLTEKHILSEQASKGGRARVNNDPKQIAKKNIVIDFKNSKYPFNKHGYKAKFINEMSDKYPIIKSRKTIENLVTKLYKNTPSAS